MLNLSFSLYNKYLKKKLFNKIFLIYSTIIILSLLALSFFVSTNFTQTIKQKELYLNKQVLDSISNHFNENYYSSLSILQQLYVDYDLSSDLAYFLKHDIDEYYQHRLDINTPGRSSLMGKFQTYFASSNSRDPNVYSIILYSKEKEFFYVNSNINNSRYCLYDSSSQKLAEKLFRKKPPYYPYVNMALDIFEDNHYGYGIVNGINDPDTLENIGCLIINYDIKGIYKSYQKFSNDVKGYIVILTRDGDVIFDSSNRYYGDKYPYFEELSQSSSSKFLDEKSLVNVVTSPTAGVTFAGIIPESQITASSKLKRRTIYLVTLLLIIGSIVLTYFSMFVFSKRTNIIMSAMKKLQQGNLSVRIPIDNKEDELSQIAVSFNSMCTDLNEYIEKVYLAEIKQKSAELVALQTQINPHFLYNTLEAIRMKAVSRGVHDVGDMIYILAALFRNSVKKDMIINISDEIDLCNLYLELFRIRYEDKLTFNMNIHNEIMKYSIVKHTLQPIIENCIVHGIDLENTGNIITIDGFKIQDSINILIWDNGTGMEKEDLEHLKNALAEQKQHSSSSIGLVNVNDRLKIIYGNDYGLEIESDIGVGTLIVVKIPTIKKEEINTNVQGIHRR